MKKTFGFEVQPYKQQSIVNKPNYKWRENTYKNRKLPTGAIRDKLFPPMNPHYEIGKYKSWYSYYLSDYQNLVVKKKTDL